MERTIAAYYVISLIHIESALPLILLYDLPSDHFQLSSFLEIMGYGISILFQLRLAIMWPYTGSSVSHELMAS